MNFLEKKNEFPEENIRNFRKIYGIYLKVMFLGTYGIFHEGTLVETAISHIS